MKERWKPVVGYEGAYEVSDKGRVRSLPRRVKHYKAKGGAVLKGRIIRLVSDGSMRQQVGLCVNGRPKQHRVHRLVLEAFVGMCPTGMECCHHDGNPANNKLANLRWDTHKANVADAQRHGTFIKGERVGTAKLTEIQVRAMHALSENGWSNADISRVFCVATSHVWEIINRKEWAHV